PAPDNGSRANAWRVARRSPSPRRAADYSVIDAIVVMRASRRPSPAGRGCSGRFAATPARGGHRRAVTPEATPRMARRCWATGHRWATVLRHEVEGRLVDKGGSTRQ